MRKLTFSIIVIISLLQIANADILKSINKEFVYNRKWRKLYDYQIEGIVPWQNGTAYKISFKNSLKGRKPKLDDS
jgi:hypothetical protein